MATFTNVSAGKAGNNGGAVFRAPLGTTLPTDATTALDNAFVELGFVSEDGLTNTNSAEVDTIKAWGNKEVLTVQTGKPDTFTFTLLETLDVNVLKAVYGENNVSGTLATGITVNANGDEAEAAVWVFEAELREGAYKRIVVPNGKLGELGDIVYKDDEAIGYEITLNALVDEAGQTHYEYIKRV